MSGRGRALRLALRTVLDAGCFDGFSGGLAGDCAGRWMVLRYNAGNGVAMVMRVGGLGSSVAGRLERLILSDPVLIGHRFFVWDAREMSLCHRLDDMVGHVDSNDRAAAVESLLALLSAPGGSF